LVWILPLFAARPGLGPIYHPVTHMVPPPFPQWLIVPAFAIDLLKWKLAPPPTWRGDLIFALAIAGALLLLLFPTQWMFSKFYLSPAADNAFFAGSRYWAYTSPPVGEPSLTSFWDENALTARSLLRAASAAVVSGFLGRRFGQWMSEVQR